MASDEDAPIKEALERLRTLIEERVHRERLRDQLTSLPNDAALTNDLDDHVASGRAYWVAFVEIDKFKSINDRFGYENADRLLRELARTLEALAESFGGSARAYRAHGDEFYFAAPEAAPGPLRVEVIGRNLELAREKLGALRVEAAEARGMMQCTVSVGWLVAADVSGVANVRRIRDCLERAVDAAKQRRDCVVRYQPEMDKRTTIMLRADCASCAARFSLDLPVAATRDQPLHCPNCYATVTRPPLPADVAAPGGAPDKV